MAYSIDQLLDRIREYRKVNGYSKNRLAVLADIPEGCVRGIDKEDWNPTTVTIARLEKVIPKDFVAAPTSSTKKRKGKNA